MILHFKANLKHFQMIAHPAINLIMGLRNTAKDWMKTLTTSHIL